VKFRSLRLSGFKSFVDPAELRIEPGLTGVVGPNGCGKSNLLEAIRWVMGESSARSMRGGGMEDVIFAGTTTRPARDFAEVTLAAERPEDTGGELEVIRRIERGAGSAYRINGRDARAKDVALIFADSATGAHSPALVSQGRIGAIIAAKPAERRQMLEEAAGIAGLHVRRKDAEQKLRATEANLARLDELMVEMEGRIASLRRQARAAERYRQLSDQIRLAEARLIYARWREAAQAADAAKKEAETAEGAVIRAGEAQRAAAAWQQDATTRLAEARAAAQAARDAATAIGHRLAGLRADLSATERRIAEIARARETLAADREREGALAHDAAEAIERLREEGLALDRRIAEAEAARGGMAERLATAESAGRDAEVALSQALATQAAQQADARVRQAALAAARQRLERADRERSRLAAEHAAIGAVEPLEAARATAAAARDAAATGAETARHAIATAEAAREAAAQARDAAESAASAARAALSALESEAKALGKAIAAGGAARDRVLDRIRAAPGYERALAAALGDDLDAGIGGEAARRWIGAEAQAGDPPLPTGATPLAANVTAPPELARRLAQVAVVEQDDGAALAVGQRIVTRDGRLRRWDGFVARDLGAAAAERLVRINRLAEIEAAMPEAAAAFAEARAGSAAAQSAIAEARSVVDAERGRLGTAETAHRAALREIDAAEAALDRRARRLADMQDRIGTSDAEHRAASADTSGAEEAVAALPDGSGIATEVAGLSVRAAEARARIAELRAEGAALGSALEADRTRARAAKAEAAGWRNRAGEAAKRITEMARRLAEAEAEAETLADTPGRLRATIAAAEAEGEATSAAATTAQAAERAAEDTLRKAEAASAAAGEALALARETRAGAAARHENQEMRRVEMGRIAGERFGCPAPVLPEKVGFASAEVLDVAAESTTLDRLTADRERLGPVNLVAESELAEIEAARASGIAEREELGLAVNRLRGSIGSLNREGRARLLAAFEAVDGHFRRLFTTLFAGGEAHLALIDSDDPLEAGLEIMAQPPGKKLAALTLLSGGEQALTAVALIFGLFLTNPAPICVLDEVDAPLDDANIERFCDLLDRMTQETETRYLIVTHNAVTMSRMHRLFGVTMVERGVSRLVSVDLRAAEELLAAE